MRDTRILKYDLTGVGANTTTITLHEGRVFCLFAYQDERFKVWYEVPNQLESYEEETTTEHMIVPTGYTYDQDSWSHQSSIQVGIFIWHLLVRDI